MQPRAWRRVVVLQWSLGGALVVCMSALQFGYAKRSSMRACIPSCSMQSCIRVVVIRGLETEGASLREQAPANYRQVSDTLC